MANKIRLMMSLLMIVFAGNVAFADDEIIICAQNVQNFFYSLDCERTQGNYVPISNYDTEAGRQAKANAIVNTLAPYNADIYAFNEVEAKAEGADREALDLLAAGLTKQTGFTYQVVSDGLTYDPSTDATGIIKSGFVYRVDKVEPVGENLSTAIGYTTVYPYMMRMQTFRSLASGEQFTLSMNHFKASTSNNMEEDAQKREQNSIALLKGLEQATLDPDILVLGDLNSEMGEQCLNNLVDAGYEEQILKRDENAYSYWFDYGELIDHVFANSTMAAQITDAKMLNIANPHSIGRFKAYSDHDPYLVTLNLKTQPAPSYCYKRASTLETGTPYLVVASIIEGELNVPDIIDLDKDFSYQYCFTVTETDGIVTLDKAKYAVIFEEAGDGNYLIKDYYGRYYYNYYYSSSSSYGHNSNCGIKSKANAFSVTRHSDSAFKIFNTTSGYYLIGMPYSNRPEFAWYPYTTLNSTQHYPWLYQYDPNATPDAITTIEVQTQPVITRKVVENGNIYILTPNGHRYTLQGVKVE